ncbi:uroporphyrinogen-III synthase [Paenirhodobacter enshiensis]|nr:uroporphyrinogen-III synthase [Paenirhodobacter enshiensis]
MPDDPRPTLLVTRPRAGAIRFAEAFRARFGADWPVIVSPLTELRPTGAPIPEAGDYIFTSEQAVFVMPPASALPRAGRRAWCVGMRTAEAARAAGFEAIEGPGDAAGLWRMLLAEAPEGPLVHVRGEEVAVPLAEMLNDAGLEAQEVVVYRQERLPLTPEATAALAGTAALLVPVFSPRTARTLTDAVADTGTERRAPIWLAAISGAVLAAAGGLRAEQAEIAGHPDAAGVLDALERLMRVQ